MENQALTEESKEEMLKRKKQELAGYDKEEDFKKFKQGYKSLKQDPQEIANLGSRNWEEKLSGNLNRVLKRKQGFEQSGKTWEALLDPFARGRIYAMANEALKQCRRSGDVQDLGKPALEAYEQLFNRGNDTNMKGKIAENPKSEHEYRVAKETLKNHGEIEEQSKLIKEMHRKQINIGYKQIKNENKQANTIAYQMNNDKFYNDSQHIQKRVKEYKNEGRDKQDYLDERAQGLSAAKASELMKYGVREAKPDYALAGAQLYDVLGKGNSPAVKRRLLKSIELNGGRGPAEARTWIKDHPDSKENKSLENLTKSE